VIEKYRAGSACKAAYAGSIPTLASIANKDSGALGRLFLWLEASVGPAFDIRSCHARARPGYGAGNGAPCFQRATGRGDTIDLNFESLALDSAENAIFDKQQP
jgi:hypothetical protein